MTLGAQRSPHVKSVIDTIRFFILRLHGFLTARTLLNQRRRSREPSPSVLLLFGRVILQQFLHSLVQLLLVLFLVRTRVKRLGGISSPHELLRRWIIHIENQSSHVDCRTRCSRHSTPTDAAAHAVCVPLRLLTDCNLIAEIKISLVVVGLGHAFDASCESLDCLIRASTIWFGCSPPSMLTHL